MTQLYKQTTALKKYNNCILDVKPTDINSIYFWFDECYDVIPSQYIVGKKNSEYKVIFITDNISMDGNYNCGIQFMYYKNNYVKRNYKIYCKKNISDLIGKYVLDWSKNRIKNKVKKLNSKYIHIDYYSECNDDE